MTGFPQLQHMPRTWLVTGVAGFIGSNLLESLLALNQTVVGLDNFATGKPENLSEVKSLVSDAQWRRFSFIKGDIRSLETCRTAVRGVDYVLHQAALGSVPRSLADPISTNDTNIGGFLNMLIAARDAGVSSFVYAASSSTYGDNPDLPKREDKIGKPLSPYAVTKHVNELYADVFARSYGFPSIGLRYFNVFGPRQDPEGAYAAVIPKWFAGLLRGEPIYINGDGETSRDFCYIANCIQANLLSAVTDIPQARNQVYNIACGEQTTLNDLFRIIRRLVSEVHPEVLSEPVYRDFRPGDVKHSLADIEKAKTMLSYNPLFSVRKGLELSRSWYIEFLSRKN